MPRLTLCHIGLGALVLGLSWPVAAQAPEPTPDAVADSPVDAGTIRRTVTLDELGYADGVDMQGLSGSRDFYFPVPDISAVRGLHLVLPYRSASAFESRRNIQVTIAGKPRLTEALPMAARSAAIDIPVTPDMVENGFVHARIDYTGAITEDRCIDQRVSGAYFSLAGTGGLIENLSVGDLSSVASVAAAMPRATDIVVPASPNEAQAAAALVLAAGNPEANVVSAAQAVDGGAWKRARIVIGDASGPALQVTSASVPAITVGGRDPVAAARLLRARWRTLAGTGQVGAVRQTPAKETPDRINIGDLGSDTSIQRVTDRGEWQVSLPATRIPVGKRVTGISLDVAVADDGGQTPPIISATMNGVLLGSAEAKRGGRTHLALDMPSGLMNAANALDIAVTRQVRGGDCAYAPQGYDAQLLPSTHFTLGNAGPTTDFYQVAPQFADGVTISLPGPATLPGTAALLGSLIDGATPVRVRYGDAPESGPYVWVSDNAPPGTAPPVRFDQGPVRLTNAQGVTLIDAAAIGRQTVVQLIGKDEQSVLWVRPGKDFGASESGDTPVNLGLGDVAFVAANRVTMAFSTTRDRLIDIRYPDNGGIGEFLHKYRLWLIGLGWLVLSIGFILLLRGIYRARKSE